MPQSFSKELLSGSTHGSFVTISGTNSAGANTIHTAISGTTSFDLVTLYACNIDADGETRTLTVEWGATGDTIVVPIPCKVGPVLVCEQLPIRNSLVVEAFADEASDVEIFGWVDRVTVS